MLPVYLSTCLPIVATTERGDKMYLARGRQALAQSAVADLAVDGNRNVRAQPALVAQARLQPRVTCLQLRDDFAYRLPLHRHNLLPIRQITVQGWDPDLVLHEITIFSWESLFNLCYVLRV